MDVHKNAPLTPIGREGMVRRVIECGQTPQAVGTAVGVCPRTVRKWVGRFRAAAPVTQSHPVADRYTHRGVAAAALDWSADRSGHEGLEGNGLSRSAPS